MFLSYVYVTQNHSCNWRVIFLGNNIGMLCFTGQAFKDILSELDIHPLRYFSIENYTRREMYTLFVINTFLRGII